MARSQLSAIVAESTKALLDRYADAHGMKKGHLVEEAVLHHLRALEDLPDDVIIPPRLVVDEGTGSEILRRLEGSTEPTDAMRDLMSPE